MNEEMRESTLKTQKYSPRQKVVRNETSPTVIGDDAIDVTISAPFTNMVTPRTQSMIAKTHHLARWRECVKRVRVGEESTLRHLDSSTQPYASRAGRCTVARTSRGVQSQPASAPAPRSASLASRCPPPSPPSPPLQEQQPQRPKRRPPALLATLLLVQTGSRQPCLKKPAGALTTVRGGVAAEGGEGGGREGGG